MAMKIIKAGSMSSINESPIPEYGKINLSNQCIDKFMQKNKELLLENNRLRSRLKIVHITALII